jgi:hypothetical protein
VLVLAVCDVAVTDCLVLVMCQHDCKARELLHALMLVYGSVLLPSALRDAYACAVMGECDHGKGTFAFAITSHKQTCRVVFDLSAHKARKVSSIIYRTDSCCREPGDNSDSNSTVGKICCSPLPA